MTYLIRTIFLSHKLLFSLFLFCVVVFLYAPAKASAAARFYLSPSSGSFKVGDKITASVMIDTGGQAINAAEGSVTFPSNILEYQSVSTSGSIFTFWTSGPNGDTSVVSFSGGLPSPGYTGSSGKVLTITWNAKTTGTAAVTINGSKILANDGVGTNIYGSSSGGSFSIGGATTATPKPVAKGVPIITSATHPDQTKWYAQNSVSVGWTGTSEFTGYVFSFDQASSGNPPDAPLINELSTSFEQVADGMWYFHLKAKTTSGFTEAVHYKVQIDTTPPDPFQISVKYENGLTPIATFEARDATSGVESYVARINGGKEFAVKSGDDLPRQLLGQHRLTVKAIDKAGNTRESSVKYNEISLIRVAGYIVRTEYALVGLGGLILILIFVLFVALKRRKLKEQRGNFIQLPSHKKISSFIEKMVRRQ